MLICLLRYDEASIGHVQNIERVLNDEEVCWRFTFTALWAVLLEMTI